MHTLLGPRKNILIREVSWFHGWINTDFYALSVLIKHNCPDSRVSTLGSTVNLRKEDKLNGGQSNVFFIQRFRYRAEQLADAMFNGRCFFFVGGCYILRNHLQGFYNIINKLISNASCRVVLKQIILTCLKITLEGCAPCFVGTVANSPPPNSTPFPSWMDNAACMKRPENSTPITCRKQVNRLCEPLVSQGNGWITLLLCNNFFQLWISSLMQLCD